MAANLAIGLITALIAVIGGVSVAQVIEEEVPDDRSIPGVTIPGYTSPRVTVPEITAPEVPAQPAPPPESSRVLQAPLYRASTFRRILGRLRRAAGRRARLTTMRVAAQDVVAQVQGVRRRILFLVRAGGLERTVTTPSIPGPLSFPLAQVRPGVPARLVRRAARRAGVNPGRVDYLVATVTPVAKRPQWLIFVRGGRGFYRARIDGSRLEKLG
jgi:hypothetical protein